jgi:LmbE family N-acetylglucosaminyl deacetylase
MAQFDPEGRITIIAAHPDDETIGAGALLRYLPQVKIIHVTDGSPADLALASRSGFSSREEYSAARRRELECALALAGLSLADTISLGFTDQETMYHLPELCDRLTDELSKDPPDLIVTHPYEGGHPDHDSIAFAVRRVCGPSTRLFEMTSYHEGNAGLTTGVFLPNGEPGTVIRELTREDRAIKQKMLACFDSQASVLINFPVVPELFRPAPDYDFTQPPAEGSLYYEKRPWGITGRQWRDLAAQCLRTSS